MWCCTNYSQLSDGNYWDWHKMSVLMAGATLIESKRKWLTNSRDQLDFLEVPYLLIVLLYNISSIISSLLILYIVDKETGKYFLNQVWLSLAAVNKFNQEWNWIILDMKYTSVLGLLVTLKSLFFNGLIAVTCHLYFICAWFCIIFLFAIYFSICMLYKCFMLYL